MSQKVIDVTLGLDPSTKIIGFAFVTSDEGEPLWHGIVKINEPDKGWRDQQISRQLAALKASLDAHSIVDEVEYRCTAVGIERMFLGPSPKVAMELSYVAGAVHQATRQTFPTVEILRFLPPDWREKVGLERNASKAALAERATELGSSPDTPQDEVDSILIALAARNTIRSQPAVKAASRPSSRGRRSTRVRKSVASSEGS